MSVATNIVITGVGGQGNVSAARLLAIVALKNELEVAVGDVYGLTQRGGSVASHVRWCKDHVLPPLVPQRTLDILIAFEPLEALRVQTQLGHKGTTVLVNETPIMPIGVQAGRFQYPHKEELWTLLDAMTGSCQKVAGSATAKELGNIQCLNIVMLGALCSTGLTGFGADVFEETIQDEMPAQLVDLNLKAFRRGLALENL